MQILQEVWNQKEKKKVLEEEKVKTSAK